MTGMITAKYGYSQYKYSVGSTSYTADESGYYLCICEEINGENSDKTETAQITSTASLIVDYSYYSTRNQSALEQRNMRMYIGIYYASVGDTFVFTNGNASNYQNQLHLVVKINTSLSSLVNSYFRTSRDNNGISTNDTLSLTLGAGIYFAWFQESRKETSASATLSVTSGADDSETISPVTLNGGAYNSIAVAVFTLSSQSTVSLHSTNSGGSSYATKMYGVFKIADSVQGSYSVRYNANGGTGTMPNQTIAYGTATPLSSNTFSMKDNSFLGWDTSPAGTTVVYTDGQTVTDIAQPNQTIDLYAVWRKAFAYILMDDNGDYYSVTQSGATQTLVPLSGISTLTAAVFYGQGFQFVPDDSILQSLSDPTIYLWAADPWTYMDCDVDAIPYPQEIKTEVDLSGAHITGIKDFAITYTGNVNVGYTYDGSTPSSTMTAAAFLALDPDNIYAGLTSAKKLYVFFYLQDENAILTQFTVNYKRRKFH